ncbi:sugar transferase [Citrobacter cronae]|uniref:sugar transferase n=1 Tax=Citrobacter freundii complex TaxID=1344959 RepID=UPI00333510B3|nr:sugar transferase [Citrobacter werkmanii]
MKRLLDIVVSFVALVILSPLIIFISYKIKKNIGSPVLFQQQRPGLHGRPFYMVKFRTMRDACDQYGKPLPDEERMTAFGNKLRNSSLDELPELWNVLRGDMSLVGPRPLLMQYLPLYNKQQMRRHAVRPGITGWAQINGRNSISWQDKFNFDVWYVDNRSFLLDCKILLLTIKKAYTREGISAEGHVTIEPFRGNNNE